MYLFSIHSLNDKIYFYKHGNIAFLSRHHLKISYYAFSSLNYSLFCFKLNNCDIESMMFLFSRVTHTGYNLKVLF